MMKKILALLLAVAVLASMLSISALGLGAEDFSDVKESSWYYEDVDFMAKHEYMNGFPDGTFRPQDLLTREQVAVIFARIWGADVSNNDVAPYDDVVPGRYSSGAIQWLKDTGLTTGTGNNKFSPQGTLTRQEFATFAARFTKYYLEEHPDVKLVPKNVVDGFNDMDQAADWAVESIEYCREQGLLYGFPGPALQDDPGQAVDLGAGFLFPFDRCRAGFRQLIGRGVHDPDGLVSDIHQGPVAFDDAPSAHETDP